MKHSVAGSVGSGMKNTWNMTVMMYKVIKQLFTGDVSVSELASVGIVYAVNQSAKAGVIYVVYLASLLSLNLAIMNMLPFPALDGGRLLFLLIRKITGKRITRECHEGKIHFIGIILLMVDYGICDLERYRQIHRTYIQLMPGDAGRQEGYVI